jgi:hypothetical protein
MGHNTMPRTNANVAEQDGLIKWQTGEQVWLEDIKNMAAFRNKLGFRRPGNDPKTYWAKVEIETRSRIKPVVRVPFETLEQAEAELARLKGLLGWAK